MQDLLLSDCRGSVVGYLRQLLQCVPFISLEGCFGRSHPHLFSAFDKAGRPRAVERRRKNCAKASALAAFRVQG